MKRKNTTVFALQKEHAGDCGELVGRRESGDDVITVEADTKARHFSNNTDCTLGVRQGAWCVPTAN